jgi:hypothetical protein
MLTECSNGYVTALHGLDLGTVGSGGIAGDVNRLMIKRRVFDCTGEQQKLGV